MRVALLIPAVALLTACAGGSHSVRQPSSADPIGQAVGATRSESYRYTVDTVLSDGSVDGTGEYRGATSAAHETFGTRDEDLGLTTTEAITIGEDRWIRTIGPVVGARRIDKWLLIRVGETIMINPVPVEVRFQLRLLEVSTDLHQVGIEQVDGVDTFHYTGTVSDAAVRASALDDRAKSALLDGYVVSQRNATQVEAWVDHDNKVRRFVQIGTDDAGTYTTTVTFRDYGATTAVAAPPNKDIDADQ